MWFEGYFDVGDIIFIEDDVKVIDKVGVKGEFWFDCKVCFEKVLIGVVFLIVLIWFFKIYCCY